MQGCFHSSFHHLCSHRLQQLCLPQHWVRSKSKLLLLSAPQTLVRNIAACSPPCPPQNTTPALWLSECISHQVLCITRLNKSIQLFHPDNITGQSGMNRNGRVEPSKWIEICHRGAKDSNVMFRMSMQEMCSGIMYLHRQRIFLIPGFYQIWKNAEWVGHCSISALLHHEEGAVFLLNIHAVIVEPLQIIESNQTLFSALNLC